jgi:CHASE2 domain-containing sensor protein
VGIAAFIFGWIPFAGLILAVVGIVLGILTLRKPRGKGFGVTGLILSGLAVLTGLMVLFLIFMWLPMASFS